MICTALPGWQLPPAVAWRVAARIRCAALLVCLGWVLGAADSAAQAPAQRLYTFSWPFSEADAMQPRGGTSRGAALVLATEPGPEWAALQAPGLSDFERDRRAILAMAGEYRTSFDFIETVGFMPGHEPARPYQSWGTEQVFVVEDAGDRIILQHIMVMFVAGADGEVLGPFVQKHWRQDWTWEDTDVHEYVGVDRWQRTALTATDVAGTWSQAVYQVDDSPRYEAVGRWQHSGNYSAWTGHTRRPLPRRESSVRSDYNVLVATNRHTIVPTGWVQEEENLKARVNEDGVLVDAAPYLARELGVNRYERVAGFDFSAGTHYWTQTAGFWAAVREAWAQLFAAADTIIFAEERDGTALWQEMFSYAAALEAGEPFSAADSRRFAREAISRYARQP